MGMLAVALFALGVVLRGNVAAVDGNTVAGFGQVLIGLAAVIAALAGLRNGRRINEASTKAEVAAVHASDAASSSAAAVATLGPANGQTLRQMLDKQGEVLAKVAGFEEYQHSRNHDLIQGIARLDMAMPTLINTLERLIARLDETESK